VYILDFSDTIYGKTIQVEANTYLREQQSFQNNQALIDQYNRDVLDIRDFYNLPKI
jgi:FAD synthase